ncbi:hypothetical protein BGZ97_002174 [Linnemannia gamsii]|uniref:PKS/mFAS DH domain-containing protein n=1 Tax=Linnemannia gamsii TaxID=64522 RepID=A0A9P6RK94_9FUNG|nr:hypothetical protein BGZ97_002174 [Linnemannia gamsii]
MGSLTRSARAGVAAPSGVPTVFSGPVVVVLSARNEEQLRNQVQQLLAYLGRQAEVSLADLAYTLQVGREALGVRLALLVSTVDGLLERLSGYTRNEAPQEDTYQGELKRSQEMMAVFRADEGMQKLIKAWATEGKLSKLAQLWVQGLEVEWEQLYGETKPHRISLPTYPFAKERYWVPRKVPPGGAERQLHPLVHRNTSSLSQQRFSMTLTGEEFFLCDHVVQGERVVPGAAQLEWVRAAVALASDNEESTAGLSVVLENVTWLRPLVVTQRQDVHIGLEAQEDSQIGFEIYGGSGDEVVVYSQGWAQLCEVGEDDSKTVAELAVAVDELQLQVEHALTELVSVQLKIARESLQRDTPLSEFGFDSITLTEFGNALHQNAGRLSGVGTPSGASVRVCGNRANPSR